MPRTPARFTQADIARAIRAMREAGVRDVRVRITREAVLVEADRPDLDDRGKRWADGAPERVVVL